MSMIGSTKICSDSDGQHAISSGGLDRASGLPNAANTLHMSAICDISVDDPQQTSRNIAHALDLGGIRPAAQGAIPVDSPCQGGVSYCVLVCSADILRCSCRPWSCV